MAYPLKYSGLENFMDRGGWRATVRGVAKNQTRLRDFHFLMQVNMGGKKTEVC